VKTGVIALQSPLPLILTFLQELLENDQGPAQRVHTHKKVAYTLFHINDQMYQEQNDRGNVRCLRQTSGLSTHFSTAVDSLATVTFPFLSGNDKADNQ